MFQVLLSIVVAGGLLACTSTDSNQESTEGSVETQEEKGILEQRQEAIKAHNEAVEAANKLGTPDASWSRSQLNEFEDAIRAVKAAEKALEDAKFEVVFATNNHISVVTAMTTSRALKKSMDSEQAASSEIMTISHQLGDMRFEEQMIREQLSSLESMQKALMGEEAESFDISRLSQMMNVEQLSTVAGAHTEMIRTAQALVANLEAQKAPVERMIEISVEAVKPNFQGQLQKINSDIEELNEKMADFESQSSIVANAIDAGRVIPANSSNPTMLSQAVGGDGNSFVNLMAIKTSKYGHVLDVIVGNPGAEFSPYQGVKTFDEITAQGE